MIRVEFLNRESREYAQAEDWKVGNDGTVFLVDGSGEVVAVVSAWYSIWKGTSQ